MNYIDHLIQSALDEDQGPSSIQEIAQHTVAMAVRGAYEATSELVRLRCDPVAGPLVALSEGELWACKGRLDLLLSEIRAEQDLRPVPALRIVR
jgi:hypothetical protein